MDERDIEKCGTWYVIQIVAKTIAILGDRWWPQTAKHEGMSPTFCCNYMEKT